MLGVVNLLPEGVNPSADFAMRMFKANPTLYNFECGYRVIKEQDGVILEAELLEISLVPNFGNKRDSTPSMALDDLIDDLAD